MAAKVFVRLEKLKLALVAQLREDLRDCPCCRELVVLKKIWTYEAGPSEFFFLHEDNPNLESEIHILENFRLIEDFGAHDSNAAFANEVKRFRITEKLAEFLSNSEGSAVHSDETHAPSFQFHKNAETWTLAFGGQAIQVQHRVGLDYIADLLRRPNVFIAASELAGRSSRELKKAQLPGLEVVDSKAISQVTLELHEQQSRLANVPENNWAMRAEIRENIERLKTYLAQAKNQHGSPRKAKGTVQLARTSVTNAIKLATRHVAKHDADLAHHLTIFIKTGNDVIYCPPAALDWHF